MTDHLSDLGQQMSYQSNNGVTSISTYTGPSTNQADKHQGNLLIVSIFLIPEIQVLISILLIFLSDEEMVVMRPAVHYSTEEIFIQL